MIPSFYRVKTLDVTTSTNDDIRKKALDGEEEGLVIKAKYQTDGKGRMGRYWNSPEGNLYTSLLLRPRVSLKEAAFYSFVAALAVLGAIQKIAPRLDVKLKWPNDVLVNNRKISGIMIETSGEKDGRIEWLMIGVGINVFTHPMDTPFPATSFFDEGIRAEVDDVLEAFLTELEQWRQTLIHDGFSPVRRAWLASARGGEMIVRLPSGERRGFFSGIDEEGRLILRLEDGTEEAIHTGDVFFKGAVHASGD